MIFKEKSVYSILLLSALYFLLSTSLYGCASFKKKFVRNPKEAEKPTPIVQTKDYTQEYSDVLLYKKHYLFWKYWQEELINSLGSNRKKERRCTRAALDELKTLGGYLNSEGKEHLAPYIAALETITEEILSKKPIGSKLTKLKRELEKHKRNVQRSFFYKDVEEWVE